MSIQMYAQVGISDSEIANAMKDDPAFGKNVLLQVARHCSVDEIAQEVEGPHEADEMIAFFRDLHAALWTKP